MVESTEDAIFLVDRGGAYLFMNGKHLSRIGCQADKVIGKTYGDFHLTEDSKEFVGEIEEVFETGETTQHEHKSHRDNKYFLRTLSPVKSSEGHTTSVTVVSKEISERKQAEEALRESEEKFRSLVGNIPGVSYRCRCDEHWTMDFISDEVKNLTGYPASDFLQNAVRSWASIMHPEGKEASEEYAMEKINRKEPYTLEFRIIGADGNIRWCYEKGQGVFDEQGKLRFLDGVIVDHTDLKQAEKALRKGEERFSGFAKASGYGFAMGKLDGQLVFGNPACLRIVEEERKADFTAKTFYQYYSEEDKKFLTDDILPIVMSKGQWKGDLSLHTAKGNLTQTEQNIFLISDDHGNPQMVGNIITDISSRKEAEAALQESEAQI